MNSSVLSFGGCLAFLSLAAMGCAKPHSENLGLREVSGKVLLSKGAPLKGGRIVLRPAGGLRPAVSADIKPDGSFTIAGSSEQQPVFPGEYQVFVVFGKDPKHRALKAQVPKKYQSVSEDESDHYVTIDEDAKNLVVKLRRT